MHLSAMKNGLDFFEAYGGFYEANAKVVEIGARNVNGSLRAVTPDFFTYVGVDQVKGKGIDVVLEDPYVLPFDSESVDIVVSSSCFEHVELFWVSFLEVMRVLKPKGLFYLNAPSNGSVHRFPVDCWRFYPDSGAALVTWAKHNGMVDVVLMESYFCLLGKTGKYADRCAWRDFVAVFLKDKKFIKEFTARVADSRGETACHATTNY